MEKATKSETKDVKTARKSSSYLLILCTLLSLYCTPLQSQDEKVVAITQIVAHPSLDQAKAGILDELKESGFIKGKNLKIIEENAQNNLGNAVQIAKKLVSLHPDAIVAISTPSAQTAVNAAKNTGIPVVYSSVTDPESAGLANQLGVTDFPPLIQEQTLIKTLVPHVKKIGILYNPGEANSHKTVTLIKDSWENEIVLAQVTHSNQIGQALNSLIGKVDAIYLPSDNTVFSALPLIVKVTRKNHIPVFTSDPDAVKSGALACAGYSQYDVGRAAGKAVVNLLNGKNPVKSAIKPENFAIYLNETTAVATGIEIRSELLGKNVNIVR